MSLVVNNRTADHDIAPMFLERWSPRAFTGEPMTRESLLTLVEAARWAPSAFNGQPWRFVYGLRGTAAFDGLLDLLIPFNQIWARNASALIFILSDRFRRVEGQPPAPVHSHSFDAGAAWGFLALQASQSGWAAHGMVGFDMARAYADLGVDEAEYRIEAAVAVGRIADRDTLEEPLRSREIPSPRRSVVDLIFEGRFQG